MRCSNCGRENPASERFCATCGRPLYIQRRPASGTNTRHAASPQGGRPVSSGAPRSVPGSRPRPAGRPVPARGGRPAGGSRPQQSGPRTRWNPKFLAACAGILALLILIPILIAVASHSRDTLETRRIQMFYSGASGKTSVVFAGKAYEQTIIGKVARTLTSADGKSEAVLTDAGQLYYVTPEKLKSVANDVADFALSADGSRLGYLKIVPEESSTDGSETTEEEQKTTTTTTTTTTSRHTVTEPETTDATTTEYVPSGGEKYLDYANSSLFLYNTTDGSSPLVTNHVAADSITLSPSGGCIGYVVTDESGESFEGFVYQSGVVNSVGRNARPLAVSDDGKRCYFVKFEKMEEDTWVQKLFVRFGDAEIKLAEYADANLLQMYLNSDLSQVVFSTTGSEGAFYYCDDAMEKVKMVQGFKPVYAFAQKEVAMGKTILTPFESFTRQVFIDAVGTAQYLDSKHNCVNIGASGTFFRITPDGKTLYYVDDAKKLYSCIVRKLSKKDIASDVMNFDISADGKILYYITSDNKLHCFTGKDTVLAEGVYTVGNGLTVTDGGYLYFLVNYNYGKGTLCYVKGDGTPKVLEKIGSVHDIAYDQDDCIYYRDSYNMITGTYNLYYGKTKKYTKVFEHMG